MPRKRTSITKKYHYEGTAYELGGFTYKRQVTFEDCKFQFVATLLGNKMRSLSNASRKIGLPDEFGEGLARHHNPNLVSFRAKTGKKGDMFDEIKEYLQELKTLTSGAPTSFSPTSRSEHYVICDVDMNTSEYKIYNIPHSILSTAEINSQTTLNQQWATNEVAIAEKKTAPRPRFSMRKFISKKEIKPDFFGTLLEKWQIEAILSETNGFWSDKIENIILGGAK
jgi:hypothetical protein